MASEQMDLTENQIAAESFDRKFATHRRNFKENLENKVRRKLPGTDLSKLGDRLSLTHI